MHELRFEPKEFRSRLGNMHGALQVGTAPRHADTQEIHALFQRESEAAANRFDQRAVALFAQSR
jgi:hypothetical protein